MRIVLGIPVVHVVPGQCFSPLLAFAASIGRRGEVIIPEVLNVFPYDNARKLVTDCAEKHDADYIMFVDSDMIPPPNAFDLLMEGIQAGARVVSGHHYKRGYPYTSTWFKADGNATLEITAGPQAGAQELDACGLACTLIDFRWVLEHVKKPFFQMYSDQGITCGEDVYFCWKVRCAGGRVLGDPRVRSGHLGPNINVCDGTVDFLLASYAKEHANV